MVTSFIFWLSLASIFYAYAGYLLVLKALAPFLSKPIKKMSWTPPVTLIISAYNEENVIGSKIKNSFELDYPKDMMEIMVVSDASSDRTDEIVRSWSSSGVKLFRVEGRVGKTSCLNLAVPEAKGEVVIFSDANSLYDPKAIREMVSNFADPGVGCVTGYTRYLSKASSTVGESIGIYAQMERATKKMESRIGSCIGADGAIFAIRKKLYHPLEATDINDLVIPLNITRQGYRTVLEEGAWCSEETARDAQGEFSRQVRITNRTLRAILKKSRLLNTFDKKASSLVFSFELLSHKIAKLLVPLFLLSVLMANLALARSRWAYRAVITLQAVFYSLALLEIRREASLLEKLMSVCRTFIVVNAAILGGWITFMRGDDFITWKTRR